MTEVCYAQEYGNWNGPPSCPNLPFGAFDDALQWAIMITADLENWASAWIYWNMILDENGGPHLTSPEHNDPVYDRQQPLVIVSNRTTVTYTGAYYALAHFGRFVQVHIGAATLVCGSSTKVIFLVSHSEHFLPLFTAWDASHCCASARPQEGQRAPLRLCLGPPYGRAAGQRLSNCHQRHPGAAIQVFTAHAAPHLDQQRAIFPVNKRVFILSCYFSLLCQRITGLSEKG
jgi:hypothetical protein